VVFVLWGAPPTPPPPPPPPWQSEPLYEFKAKTFRSVVCMSL
jgi:hypothetical protein